MRFPNTPSQEWAEANGACIEGRRRLGKQSIGDIWRNAKGWNNTSVWDLLWVVRHLAPRTNDRIPERIEFLLTLDVLSATRIKQAAAVCDISIPVRLL